MTKFHWRIAKTGTLVVALTVVFVLIGCGTTQQAVKPQAQQESEGDRLAKERAEADRKANQEAEAKARAKAKAEAEAKARTEAEARTFDSIYFDYDKYGIRGNQVPGLFRNAEKIQARPEFKLTIEEHCDERGTTEHSLDL